MFLQLGDEYVNLSQLARVQFTGGGVQRGATLYFAKPGGSDRHMISGPSVAKLEEALQQLTPDALAAMRFGQQKVQPTVEIPVETV